VCAGAESRAMGSNSMERQRSSLDAVPDGPLEFLISEKELL